MLILSFLRVFCGKIGIQNLRSIEHVIAPRIELTGIATYKRSAVNADRKPDSNFSPISDTWAESKFACGLQCIANKECKMFTFAENSCSIYSQEIERVTFVNHPGSNVYHKEN